MRDFEGWQRIKVIHSCQHKVEHMVSPQGNALYMGGVYARRLCPECRISTFEGKYLVITQADSSKWAIPLETLDRIFRDHYVQDHHREPVYGADYSQQDIIIHSQELCWCEVVEYAHVIQPSPDGGPDYNWGWQHGDPTIQEMELPEPIENADSYYEAYGIEGHYPDSDEQEAVERADNAWDDEPYTYHGAYDLDIE